MQNWSFSCLLAGTTSLGTPGCFGRNPTVAVDMGNSLRPLEKNGCLFFTRSCSHRWTELREQLENRWVPLPRNLPKELLFLWSPEDWEVSVLSLKHFRAEHAGGRSRERKIDDLSKDKNKLCPLTQCKGVGLALSSGFSHLIIFLNKSGNKRWKGGS